MYCDFLGVDKPAWVRFVSEHPQSSLFHQPIWSHLLQDVYGYEPSALAVIDEAGHIAAGLPIADVRSGLTGRRFVSLPFTDYCPPLLRDGVAQDDVAQALMRYWGRQTCLEIRSDLRQTGDHDEEPDAVRHTLAINGDERALYAGFSKMHKQNIHRAEREGVSVIRADTRAGMEAFYRLQLSTRRRLGVPAQPWAFFARLYDLLIRSGMGSVLLAEHEGVAVAGAVLLRWNDTMVFKYMATDAQAWPLRAGNVLTWEIIRQAARTGCRAVDFGRTNCTQPGLRSYKDGWGAAEVPLRYCLLSRHAFTEKACDPWTGSLSLMLGKVIRHSPMVVCRTLGQVLYPHVG